MTTLSFRSEQATNSPRSLNEDKVIFFFFPRQKTTNTSLENPGPTAAPAGNASSCEIRM